MMRLCRVVLPKTDNKTPARVSINIEHLLFAKLEQILRVLDVELRRNKRQERVICSMS